MARRGSRRPREGELAQHRIAVIPGDGIGKEVVPEGLRVLDAAARKFRVELQLDLFVVRENTEGEYSSVGGRMYEGTDREVVFQQSCFSRKGVDRILKFAFDLAKKRPKKHLTSATKSNGISITMPYWDERVEAMA